ncbi:hypothetical protein D3C77_284540 [compost metagenome]
MLELVELAVGVFGGFEQQAFGQLQFQQVRRQGFFLEDIGDRGDQVRVGELLGREVDCHLQVAQAFAAQALAHAAGLAGDPFADGDDQAGFFSHADELVRADHALLRVVPAQQRLQAQQAAAAQAQLGLVEHVQLVLGQGSAQVVLDEQLVAGFGVQGLGEHLDLMLAIGLGLVQGQACVLHQCLRVAAMQGRAGQAH